MTEYERRQEILECMENNVLLAEQNNFECAAALRRSFERAKLEAFNPPPPLTPARKRAAARERHANMQQLIDQSPTLAALLAPSRGAARAFAEGYSEAIPVAELCVERRSSWRE